jgi:hypothetical protein
VREFITFHLFGGYDTRASLSRRGVWNKSVLEDLNFVMETVCIKHNQYKKDYLSNIP